MCGPNSVEGNGSTVYIGGYNAPPALTGRRFLASSRSLLATQCTSFTQVTGGPVGIVATTSFWAYAKSADCPTACTICQSGCLFCSVRG